MSAERLSVQRLLFVCTGNTCRSPMAEVLARRLAEGAGMAGLAIASAGTAATDGAPASANARKVAAERGFDLSCHRARTITAAEVAAADLIIAMTEGHRRFLARFDPDVRVVLATDFLPAGHTWRETGVPDPFGRTIQDYETTWMVLDECIEGLFRQLSLASRS